MLAYEHQGQGPAVVFIHGFGGSRAQWYAYLPAVAQAGFAAYALDLPGHGQSPPPPARLPSTLAWVDDLARWLDAHIAGPVHLVGHSLGGYLALAYAQRHPRRVRSLSLIAPLLAQDAIRAAQRGLLWLSNRLPYLPAAWPRGTGVLLRGLLALYPEAWHMRASQRRRRLAELMAMSPRVVWALRRVPDLRPRVRGLPVRTWVVGGAHDSVLDPASYASLAQVLPHCTVWMLPHSGHIPHLSEPDALRVALLAWLRGQPLPSPPHAARTRAGNTSPAGPRSTSSTTGVSAVSVGLTSTSRAPRSRASNGNPAAG